MHNINYKNLHWLWCSLLVVIIDQITKWLAINYLATEKPIRIFAWLNLQLRFNKGAAFSFLHSAGGWQRWFFITIAVVICISIIIWLCRLPTQEKYIALALSFIFGGAIGNLWDRLTVGYVTDFIEVHANNWYFPTFNLADSAISIGAFLLFFKLLRT